jgi:hypothetical protein
MRNQLIPIERVEKLILLLRGEKVLLEQQLAELHGVPVKVLIQAVKRNRDRFPEDFMFQLSREEFDHLKSQFVTSSWGGLPKGEGSTSNATRSIQPRKGVGSLSGALPDSASSVHSSVLIGHGMRAELRQVVLLLGESRRTHLPEPDGRHQIQSRGFQRGVLLRASYWSRASSK